MYIVREINLQNSASEVSFQLRNCNFCEDHTKSRASCSDSRELRALARENFFSIEEKQKIILHTVYSKFPAHIHWYSGIFLKPYTKSLNFSFFSMLDTQPTLLEGKP